MAGVGAACAFGAVSNRIVNVGHSGSHYDISSEQEQHTPGVDLVARDDGGELIDIGLRLDELNVLPGKIGPFVSFRPDGPPASGWGPLQTQQSGPSSSFGSGGSLDGGPVVVGAASGAAAGQPLAQPPATPANPPAPDAPPPAPDLGAPGGFGAPGPLDPVLFGPSQPDGPPSPGGGAPPGVVDTGPPPPPPTIVPLPPGPAVTPPPPAPSPQLFGGGGGPPPTTAIAPVPEPAAWGAMLLGFILAGGALRLRRNGATPARATSGLGVAAEER